jgi:hypothetical protein
MGFQPVSDGGHLACRGGYPCQIQAGSPDSKTARMAVLRFTDIPECESSGSAIPNHCHRHTTSMSTQLTFQLSASFPGGVLPEVFGLLTVSDPRDLKGVKGLPGSLLGDALRIKGWRHFPADVILPGVEERLVSFAIIENFSKIERLARDFIRPCMFWVHSGEVVQMVSSKKPPHPLGAWDRFSGQPPVALHGAGNLALAENPATAFLCSTACPGEKILEACDWAKRQCDEGGTVISGFHTPVEKDVLAILARRGANIVWVPGRDLPRSIDAVFKTPMDENRLLILSPFPYGKPSRPSKESCSLRNRFVLHHAKDRYIPHVATGSSLASDIASALI